MPWNNIEYIDTDRVYWNQSIIDNLAVDGKYFLIQGDLNWPSMISTPGRVLQQQRREGISGREPL